MRIVLIRVGRSRSDPTAALASDYIGRIEKYIPFEELVIKPDRPDRMAKRMMDKASGSNLLIALDEHGAELDSIGFSNLIKSWMNNGLGRITMVIGGADGLPDEVLKRADRQLALSKMTLPHRLARVLLVEQIYRGLTIIRGVPYQK